MWGEDYDKSDNDNHNDSDNPMGCAQTLVVTILLFYVGINVSRESPQFLILMFIYLW